MGIMNKMKTVPAWTLVWTYVDDYQGDSRYYSESLKQTAMPKGKLQYNKLFITEGVKGWGTTEGSFLSNIGVLEIQTNRFKGLSAEAFKQHLQDENVLITYETIDSVEEKIVNSMATVGLWTLDWEVNGNFLRSSAINQIKFPGNDIAFVGECSMDYTPIGISPLSSSTEKRIAVAASKRLYVRDSRFRTAEALIQHLTDNHITITYQTNKDQTEEII